MMPLRKRPFGDLIIAWTILLAVCSATGCDRSDSKRLALAAESIAYFATELAARDDGDSPLHHYLIAQYDAAVEKLTSPPRQSTPFVVAATVMLAEPRDIVLMVHWIEPVLTATGFALGTDAGDEIRYEGIFHWTQEHVEAASGTAYQITGIGLDTEGVPWRRGGEGVRPPVHVEGSIFGDITQIKMILGDGTETPWAPVFIGAEAREAVSGSD
ncbi:MAG: hypothetical protein KAS72_09865 [Phycisphaerales bacterium]|nr:hypothetical protein [Phycisphaerales bacterium]